MPKYAAAALGDIVSGMEKDLLVATAEVLLTALFGVPEARCLNESKITPE
jgi:hypothetical protein